MNNLLEAFDQEQIKKLSEGKEFPDFRAGDTISVDINVSEGGGVRIQNFTGLCISKENRGLHSCFMLRKISSSGSYVERRIPKYSPTVVKIQVITRGIVRRAKLYYIRKLSGKAARIRSRVFHKATSV